MNKFRTRLAFLFILLIGGSVLAAGVCTAVLIDRSHMNALRDSLKREMMVILAAVEQMDDLFVNRDADYFARKAKMLKPSAQARVTFIAADGTVLGDSDMDAKTMDNHLNRPEIVEAAQKSEGYSRRHSDTTGSDMLYAALKVERDGETVGYIRLAMELKEAESAIRALWGGLAAGLTVVFLIAGAVSYRVARQVTRPLEKMTRVARQLTDMSYKSRVPVRSRDEIGQLGQAINVMADSLQSQLRQIRENEKRLSGVLGNMASGVVMIDREGRVVLMNRSAEDMIGLSAKTLTGQRFADVNPPVDLVRLIERCAERNEPVRGEMTVHYPQERIVEVHLAPLDREDGESAGLVIVLHDITAIRRLENVRSEFVANVSHELKTPIAAVKGFAETLLNGAMNDPETARSFLQIIYDESDRLNRLIGDLMELSKIESKRVPLAFSPVHLNSFAGKTIDMMRTEADKKGIRLEMEVVGDLYMEADEDRLRQILINLLSNGINYTPEGGTVKLTVEPVDDGAGGDGEKIRFTVSDTGIGIPKKDLPRIFERFYRVDKARSRSSGGTGLGLSIVKHLVELHKGTIRVDSEPGIGTRFVIDLPVIQS